MVSKMSQGKLKHLFQVAFFLVAVIVAAGAVLAATLTFVGAKEAVNQQVQSVSKSQLAYLRGVPATGGVGRSAAGGDYLAEIAAESGLHRWPSSKFPLKVYIADGTGVPGYRPQFKSIMTAAFQEWQTSTGGLVSWRQVSNPQQADIVSLWTADVNARRGGIEAGNTVTLTAVDPRTRNGVIQAAKITLLTGLNGRSFNDTELRKTALHEVGHALGLEGHSSTPTDIMYASVNGAQTPYLKDRDVNTLVRLYSGNTSTYTPPAVASIPRNWYSTPNNRWQAPQPALPSYSGGYGYSNVGNGGTGVGSLLKDAAWRLGGAYLRNRLGF
jgi:predicted Zn-dependent protease